MEPLSYLRSLVRPTRKVPRGFTLVEMIVVLAIIIVITGIVISGQSAYNQSLILSDTAYSVAFSVRQAQSLGLASRSAAGFTDAGYGVHFAGSAGYTIFADTIRGLTPPSSAWCPLGTTGTPEARPGNCRYDTTDQTVQNYTFSRGFRISNICAKTSGGVRTCNLAGVDIVFMRPETKAIITGSTGTSYVCAELHVAAPTGTATRIVRVSQLGEVSVGGPTQQCL